MTGSDKLTSLLREAKDLLDYSGADSICGTDVHQFIGRLDAAISDLEKGEPVATLRITELLREDAHFLERCRPTSSGIAERLREAANALEAIHAANVDLLSKWSSRTS